MLIKAPYQENDDSTVTHLGKNYSLNEIFKLVANSEIVKFKVSELEWILEFADTDQPRVANSDLTTPILVAKTKYEDKLVVLDGAHRLKKAVDRNVTLLPGRYVTDEQLQEALIE